MTVDVPVQVGLMVPEGSQVLAIAHIRRSQDRLCVAMDPVEGQEIPAGTPALLRWLADVLEVRLLPEATDV